MNHLYCAVNGTGKLEREGDGWRAARGSLPRFVYLLSVAFACLSLDCRKLTAKPAPVAAPAPTPRPAKIETAEVLYDAGLKSGWLHPAP
jgi:hypothetical protein